MTDELTPEEKEALKNLPRERTPPAGLEGRVVGAMRERGFLAKRRRTIEITNSRVAGVLAASVALMIGAYAIGLHRGDGRPALTPSATVPSDELVRANEWQPVQSPREPAADETRPRSAVEDRQVDLDSPARKSSEAKIREEKVATTPTSPPASEPRQRRARETDAVEENAVPGVPAPSPGTFAEASSPQSPTAKSAGPAERPAVQSLMASKAGQVFLLNGSRVVVEAPDSVRVVRDEQGRTLIIYTSDGIIRIRLSEER